MNKTLKIWSALLLLIASLGLFKEAYVTSNGHVAIAALIIGALFILSGLSLTMEEETETVPKEYMEASVQNAYEFGRRIEKQSNQVTFKDKITSEEKRMKLQYTGEKGMRDENNKLIPWNKIKKIPKVAKKKVSNKRDRTKLWNDLRIKQAKNE